MKGFTNTTKSDGRLTCVSVNNRVYWVGEEPICALSTEMGRHNDFMLFQPIEKFEEHEEFLLRIAWPWISTDERKSIVGTNRLG